MREVTLFDQTNLWVHDEGEQLSDAIVEAGDYFEKEILEYLSDQYPQQEIILDIGANIGNHTVYFSQYLENIAVIAFEPIRENFALLRRNTHPYPNIVIRNEAVGATRGTVGMVLNRSNMGACEVSDDKDGVEYRKVPQVRVDDLLLMPRVSLMKIDVEWYEPEVLKGAKDILETDKPLILIEDADGVYADLLPPDYELLQAWLNHKTYLFGVKDA